MARKLALIILDGIGINAIAEHNAVLAAKPKVLHYITQSEIGKLWTHGNAVGLPEGVMGNSEVGHANIGAGRIVEQYLVRIDNAIADKTFAKNPKLNRLFEYCKIHNRPLHLLGLVSDGCVHSSIAHLFELVQLAKMANVPELFIHAITDGRDTSPESGIGFIQQLQKFLKREQFGKIATISGRYFAMDRDKRWDRVEIAYRALTGGNYHEFNNPTEAVQKSYQNGTTDEFIKPMIASGKIGRIHPGDAILGFNFRADRMREISRALADPKFSEFSRSELLKPNYVTMTKYQDDFPFPFLLEPLEIHETIGEIISDLGWKQLRLAETEKYAHVTYFFNNGEEKPFPGEERKLIPSPKVATYDLQPEMSAIAVKDVLISAIQSEEFPFIAVNFANGDMVGHTGDFDAAIKAVQTVDGCLQEILKAQVAVGAWTIITADHGNCEQMWDVENAVQHTQHTLNPVPFMVFDPAGKLISAKDGKLSDIAPTILKILEIPQPIAMTGNSLL